MSYTSVRGRMLGASAAVVAVAGLVIGLSVAAGADTASDPTRAVFHDGNATTCAQVGFPTSLQLDSGSTNADLSAVEGPNTGIVQNGVGTELNVTLVNPNTVIDAVVVKGGNGYNVYLAPLSLQHLISPLNGGGNVPDISHAFVCYHLKTPTAPTTPTTPTLPPTTLGPTVSPNSTTISPVVSPAIVGASPRLTG